MLHQVNKVIMRRRKKSVGSVRIPGTGLRITQTDKYTIPIELYICLPPTAERMRVRDFGSMDKDGTVHIELGLEDLLRGIFNLRKATKVKHVWRSRVVRHTPPVYERIVKVPTPKVVILAPKQRRDKGKKTAMNTLLEGSNPILGRLRESLKAPADAITKIARTPATGIVAAPAPVAEPVVQEKVTLKDWGVSIIPLDSLSASSSGLLERSLARVEDRKARRSAAQKTT